MSQIYICDKYCIINLDKSLAIYTTNNKIIGHCFMIRTHITRLDNYWPKALKIRREINIHGEYICCFQ